MWSRILLLLLVCTATPTECSDDYDWMFPPSTCDQTFLWGDDCQYMECQCQGSRCPEDTEVQDPPCCNICPHYDCICEDHCGDNCCPLCPDGKVNKITGIVTEYFHVDDDTQVVVSDDKFQYREEAEKYCQSIDMELAYVETRQAEAELEAYMYENIKPEPHRGKVWMDGWALVHGPPWEEDWPLPRVRTDEHHYTICQGLVKSSKNQWQVLGMSCAATWNENLDQRKQALCAIRTFKYKLRVIPHEPVSHRENGQICYDEGIEMVPFTRPSIRNFHAELDRLGIKVTLWLSGLFEKAETNGGKANLRTGDTVEADKAKDCIVSKRTIQKDGTYRRHLPKRQCSEEAAIVMCYDTPKQQPRYSRLSYAYQTIEDYDY